MGDEMVSPKWLELLKASGWQTTALAAATGAFLIYIKSADDPGVAAWVFPLVLFGFLLSACLSLASIASEAVTLFNLHGRFTSWRNRKRFQESVRSYLPYMTDKEREIIGCLLAKNQKSFEAADDGGFAAGLMGRGIVQVAARPGQLLDPFRVPMVVVDAAWEIFEKERERFPYDQSRAGKAHPWRVPTI